MTLQCDHGRHTMNMLKNPTSDSKTCARACGPSFKKSHHIKFMWVGMWHNLYGRMDIKITPKGCVVE